jgi:hypothetical protein
VGVARARSTAREMRIGLTEGIEMIRIKIRLASRLLGILVLLISASLIFSNAVAAQMQPYFQQERMRQIYDRQQWLQWQQQERARQTYDRQQWLQWQQQERLRQMYGR